MFRIVVNSWEKMCGFVCRNLVGLVSQINSLSDSWVDKIATRANGTTWVTMADYLGRFTMDMVAKVRIRHCWTACNPTAV